MNQEHRARERITVELIEADVEIAFGLVDDALEQLHDGNLSFAQHALADAGKVLTDIDSRLQQLDPERRIPFGPLLEELRNSIHRAQSECA